MLNYEALFRDLTDIGLASWRHSLSDVLEQRFTGSAHGDLGDWLSVLSALPAVEPRPASLNSAAITIPAIDGVACSDLRHALLRLCPWRKGPFQVCGVYIDSEWRSDMKWDRVKDAIAPLDDRAVLDVGSGNGYYALRMHGAGAKLVIGIDPTLLYVVQFLAISHFMAATPVHILPLRLHELPDEAGAFDTVFSMGVLYHQRDPVQHLAELMACLADGGELVLETLILPGREALVKSPDKRYARMRNIWQLPTLPMLERWLKTAGFVNVRLIDATDTTTEEQRTTEWMPFESLAEALDASDPTRTIEGWPAPRRAVLVCNRP